MIENIILGIIQGVAEWLPVSSEGLLVLTKTHFFPSNDNFTAIVKLALFLHLGTFFAALIYFRNDVLTLLKTLTNFQNSSPETKKLFIFLFISTIISGTLGITLIKIIENMSFHFDTAGKFITFLIGCALLGTAYLELKAKKSGHRKIKDLNLTDGIILGIVQGFAAMPGFSRSGLTVSALLLKHFDKTAALKLSFLMSLPITLAGNIILNFDHLNFSIEAFIGLLCAFIFGWITIKALLDLAQKINFGYFVLFFGILTIISALI